MEHGSEHIELAGTHHVGSSEPSFLRGWGGIVALLVGGVIAIALSGVATSLLGYIDAAASAAGAPVRLRAIAAYWVQTAIWIGWFWIVLFGDRRPSSVLEDLRVGRGDWSLVMSLAVQIGVVGLMVGVMFFGPSGLTDAYYAYAEAAVWSRLIVVVGAIGAMWFVRRRGLLGGRKRTPASPS